MAIPATSPIVKTTIELFHTLRVNLSEEGFNKGIVYISQI